MKERRVFLNGEELQHFNRPVLTDASQIVPQKIDDHDVLGAILLARAKLRAQTRVIFSALPAPSGALDRPRLDAALSAQHFNS